MLLVRVDVDDVLPEHVLQVLGLDRDSEFELQRAVEDVLAFVNRHCAFDTCKDTVGGLDDALGVSFARGAEHDIDAALGGVPHDVVTGVLGSVVKDDGGGVDSRLAADDLLDGCLLPLGVVVDGDELGYAVPVLELVGVASARHRRSSHLGDEGADVTRRNGVDAYAQSHEEAGVDIDGAQDHGWNEHPMGPKDRNGGRGCIDLDKLAWPAHSLGAVNDDRPARLGASGLG